MNILYVCTGNICRSYAAEVITKQMYDGLYNVRSRGTTSSDNKNRSKKIKDFLSFLDFSNIPGKSKTILKEDIEWADVVFYMDENHKRYLVKHFGNIKNLISFASLINEDKISDPYPINTNDAYEKAVVHIHSCCYELRYNNFLFTYGAELELADIDTNIEIPKDVGVYDYKDYSIANSNGIGIDPLKSYYKYGSEVHITPSKSISEAIEKIDTIFKIHKNKINVNYTCNLHIHIGIPGYLKGDIDKLKKFMIYTKIYMPEVIEKIDPLPVLLSFDKSEEYLKAYREREKRRKRSHHFLLKEKGLQKFLESKNVNEFKKAFGDIPRNRYAVNLNSIFKDNRGTIEFRHFTMSINLHKIKSAFIWCKFFTELGFFNITKSPLVILNNFPELTFQEFHEFDYEIDKIFTQTGIAFTKSRRESEKRVRNLL